MKNDDDNLPRAGALSSALAAQSMAIVSAVRDGAIDPGIGDDMASTAARAAGEISLAKYAAHLSRPDDVAKHLHNARQRLLQDAKWLHTITANQAAGRRGEVAAAYARLAIRQLAPGQEPPPWSYTPPPSRNAR